MTKEKAPPAKNTAKKAPKKTAKKQAKKGPKKDHGKTVRTQTKKDGDKKIHDGKNILSSGKLRGYVERLEQLAEEKKDVGAEEKAVMADAKANGFTPKYIRAILALRAKSPSERDNDRAMTDLYMSALDMSDGLPLFRHVEGIGRDAASREHVVEALKLLTPEGGEVTISIGKEYFHLTRDKDGVHVSTEKPKAEPKPEPKKKEPHQPKDVNPKPTKAKVVPLRPPPDVTLDGAFDLGKAARKDDKPINTNPFPVLSVRRKKWDEGWRTEDETQRK